MPKGQEKSIELRHLILILALLTLTLTACPERAPPEAAQITCTTETQEADCPEGWACKAGSDGDFRCVDSSGADADLTPPELAAYLSGQ